MKRLDGNKVRRRLRNIVALLLLVAAVGVAVVFVRTLQPSRAVLEQRTADRAAWEAGQTAQQRAQAQAWIDVVRESKRQRALMGLVFLAGNIIVVATCIASARATVRNAGPGQLRAGHAFVRVLSRAAIALVAACAVMIGVALADKAIAGGDGMYSGERAAAAFLTLTSFVLCWCVSLGSAFVFLWRRSRGDPRHHAR